MRRLPELLLLAVCIASAWAYTALPPVVTADVSWMLPISGIPAEGGPRALAAFVVPSALIILLAVYRWVTAARRATYEKFSASLDIVMLCVVALAAAIHFGLLAGPLGWTGPIGTFVGVVLGACLAVMGNVMPRLRPNMIAGLRTPAMMNDPIAWRHAHASFGRTWMVGGGVVIVTALLAPRHSLVAFVGVVLASMLLAPIVSRRALARSAALRPTP